MDSDRVFSEITDEYKKYRSKVRLLVVGVVLALLILNVVIFPNYVVLIATSLIIMYFLQVLSEVRDMYFIKLILRFEESGLTITQIKELGKRNLNWFYNRMFIIHCDYRRRRNEKKRNK